MALPEVRKIFFGHKGKNALLFGLILLPNFLAALLEGISFGMLLFAFSMLSSESRIHMQTTWVQTLFPTVSMWIDTLSSSEAFTFFTSLAILLQVTRSFFTYLGSVASVFLGTRMQVEAQRKVYEQIFKFSFAFVSRYKVGDLVEYMNTPATMMRVVMDELNKGITSLLAIMASLTLMFILSPSLTLLAIVVFGGFSLLQKFIMRKISKISEKVSSHLVEFNKHIVQSLQGLRAIYIFHRQTSMMSHISATLHRLSATIKKLYLWGHASGPIHEILGILLVGVFLLLGQTQEKGAQALPLFLTFITVVYRINGRIQMLLFSVNALATHWGSVLRLEEILSKRGKEFTSHGGIIFSGLRSTIMLHQVDLLYAEGHSPAIVNFSATIPKGSTIAFVGHSGAGKSSIVDLFAGLYNPTSGSVLIDEVDLRNFDIGSWRQALGVVSQDTFIFNETIEENIRFGHVDAPFEKIIEAAQMAGAHDFIEKLPEGYQTLVGERGYRLSGGERQRIALARVLVRNPEILILDEATSNLDSESEHLIQKALAKFRGVKTIILVAHRLSTIVDADCIFVMEKGEIVERGTHETLLKEEGIYARYFALQAQRQVTHVYLHVD